MRRRPTDEMRIARYRQARLDETADAAAEIEWRPIAGQPEYFVSSDGRIRHGSAVLRGTGGPHGYRQVHTRHGLFYIHKLVAAAFLGPRPEGYDIRHLNDEKADNRIENLLYGTRRENMLDRTRNGRMPAALKTHCIRGHEFTEDNIYWQRQSRGFMHRACRTCRYEDKRRRDAEDIQARIAAGLRPRPGYCNKNLHDLTQPGALLKNGINGRRLCGECRREYIRAKRAAAKASA